MSELFTLDCNSTFSSDDSTDSDGGLLGDAEWLWLVGVGCSLVSSVATAIGTVLQKKAHMMQELLPDEEKAMEIIGIVLNRYWIFALFIMVLVPLPFDFVAFALAPQSVIVPITGLTIVLNQIFAPVLLGEKLTRAEIIATVVILVGVGFTTTSAGGNSVDYNVCELVLRYLDPDFFIVLLVLIFMIGVNLFWIHTKRHPKSLEKLRPQMYALVAGGVGAVMQIVFKATGQLAKGSVDGTKFNPWETIHPYYHILAIAVLAIVMISYINRGLQQYDAVVFTPLYFTNLIVCSSTLGAIYYKEYEGYEIWQWVLFPLGIVIVCFGILVMTLKGVNLDKVRLRVQRLERFHEYGKRRSSRLDSLKSIPAKTGRVGFGSIRLSKSRRSNERQNRKDHDADSKSTYSESSIDNVPQTREENEDDDYFVDTEMGVVPNDGKNKKIPFFESDLSDEDDEEEEEERDRISSFSSKKSRSSISSKKSRKPKKSSVVSIRSFTTDDEEEEDSRKTHRNSGNSFLKEHDQKEEEEEEDDYNDKKVGHTDIYDNDIELYDDNDEEQKLDFDEEIQKLDL